MKVKDNLPQARKKNFVNIFFLMIAGGALSYFFLTNNIIIISTISQIRESFKNLLSTFLMKDKDREKVVFERIRDLNLKLEMFRYKLLNASNYSIPTSAEYSVFYEDNLEYIEIVKKYKHVTFVYLKWKKNNEDQSKTYGSSNYNVSKVFNITEEADNWLLLKKYYAFTASEPLCEWIITGNINSGYEHMYNYTCNNKVGVASTPTDVEPMFFNNRVHKIYESGNIRLQNRFEMPIHYYVMQIFTNAIVSNLGEPFTHDFQVNPIDCLPSPSSRPDAKAILDIPYQEEVFVISQRWGEGYFHRMIENLPRLALFIEFLTEHPSIKILAYDKSKILLKLLETYGLNADRVITGWVRTKVAYVPRSTACGTPNMIELQVLQNLNYKYISENLLRNRNYTSNKLLLIRRSGRRRFSEHESIEKLLYKTALKFGLDFVVFRDDPSPSLNDTMVMFALASVVVAPHGAGLSNLVFSRPGTLVIEGLCNRPKLNLCYHRTAYSLGMRWHGIPSLGGCEGGVAINADIIDQILRAYLVDISKN